MVAIKCDLYVMTKVKELSKYIISATERSPKKFRFTMVVRIQNYCLDIIENVFLANALPVTDPKRLFHQQEAGRILNLLGYFSMICYETACILPNQYENISKLQAESLLFLGKWISSDKKRKG